MPEWQAALNALQELPEIGAEGPVGYFGLHTDTAIGVPLTAVEPRVTADELRGLRRASGSNARRPRSRCALGGRREPLTLGRGIKVAGEERGQLVDRGFRAVALRGQHH